MSFVTWERQRHIFFHHLSTTLARGLPARVRSRFANVISLRRSNPPPSNASAMRVLITGASRGIGAAIARVFAERGGEGTTLALLARSKERPSHPELEGTLLDTCRAVERAGATAVPIEVDLRDEAALRRAAQSALGALGGLDVLVHNASVLWPHPVATARRMDLLHAVNVRAVMLLGHECGAALRESSGAVVSLSPPVRTGRLEWISRHPAYTLSKYGMTLATLATASASVRANCVWPSTTVRTAATKALEATHPGAYTEGRSPEAVAEAVYRVATSRTYNARTLLDEEVCAMPPCDAPRDAFVNDALRW